MIEHSGYMAGLWEDFRSALQEFKISRLTRKNNSRFRVVEEVKPDFRDQFSSSSSYKPSLGSTCKTAAKTLHRSANVAATAVVTYPREKTNAWAGWGYLAPPEDDFSEEVSRVTDESAPIKNNLARWKEIEIELDEFTASSRSMGELGSLKWEENILARCSGSRMTFPVGESSSPRLMDDSVDHRRWENRVNNKSPELVQPVRGKLTALSGLMRTLSDRYTRRTGKLAPGRDKRQGPMLTQSHSAHTPGTTSKTSDIPPSSHAKKYDNPFQDFLRRSTAERNSRSVHPVQEVTREARRMVQSN